MLHQSRDLLVRQRTMVANAIRAHFAEFGIVALQALVFGKIAALLVGEDPTSLPYEGARAPKPPRSTG